MGRRGWRTQDGRDLDLSDRQQQVLELIAKGRTNAEIGEALGISLDGAKWHVSEIIAKLGVADREAAVAAWRRLHRTSGFPTQAWHWPLVGAGALSLIAATAVLVVLPANREDAPATEPLSSDPSATATQLPSRDDLTPSEIVRRSGEAMAAIPLLRVESAVWPLYPGPDEVSGVRVTEYTRDTERAVYNPEYDLPACPAQDSKLQVFTDRHLGGLALGGPGATGPSDFELLREDSAEGEDAWVVRYTYQRRSIEGPIRIEDTEWIAKSDYRLLRQEKVYFDMGTLQIVSIPIPITSRATACPSKPVHTLQDLTPLTPRPTLPAGN